MRTMFNVNCGETFVKEPPASGSKRVKNRQGSEGRRQRISEPTLGSKGGTRCCLWVRRGYRNAHVTAAFLRAVAGVGNVGQVRANAHCRQALQAF